MKSLVLLFLLIVSGAAIAAAPFDKTLLQHSQQLVLIIAPAQENFRGVMRLYERDANNRSWKMSRRNVPVTIGKSGLTDSKREGDHKSPMGLFPIGEAFGFQKNNHTIHLPYISLRQNTVCVDDSDSQYYNQIIHQNNIPHVVDWHSAENMRRYTEYRLGAVVQYNMQPIVKDRGSCIFIHIWSAPNIGTEGCIAMSQNNVKKLLHWLNAEKKPVIAILPAKDVDLLFS